MREESCKKVRVDDGDRERIIEITVRIFPVHECTRNWSGCSIMWRIRWYLTYRTLSIRVIMDWWALTGYLENIYQYRPTRKRKKSRTVQHSFSPYTSDICHVRRYICRHPSEGKELVGSEGTKLKGSKAKSSISFMYISIATKINLSQEWVPRVQAVQVVRC
jgi:hypothetical protein